MLLGVPNPGSWQIFLQRPDNIGLSIQEAKQKYFRELALFENEQVEKQRLYQQMAQSKGGFGVGFTGQGIDGPIAEATVLSVAEGKTTTTDSNGFFKFKFIPSGDIEITGGTDTVTGVTFTGTLKAPKGSTIISPITTAIKEIMDLGSTEEEATDAVFDYAREIYEINIPSNIRERVKKENFLTLSETNNDFLKVVGFTSILEASAEVASNGVGTANSDSVKRHKEAFYKRTATIINNNKTRLKPGSGEDWSSSSNVYNRDNFKKLSFQLSGDNITTISATNADSLRQAMDHTLDRIKEVVNDSNMDPSFGTTSVMTQNRLAKREIAENALNFGKGTLNASSLRSQSETSVAKEADEYDNIGTIFKGKQNQEEPVSEKQESLYPAAVDYVTESGSNKYAQGELTRSLSTKINGLPTYSGTIGGEATFLWYDRASRRWVLDNNLEAPFIGNANKKLSHPLTGNYTKSGDTIIIALPDVYQDQPSVGQGGENIINALNTRGAFAWNAAEDGQTNTETGVTTWQVTGIIVPSSINGEDTRGQFQGYFTITQNAGSALYVLGIGTGGLEFAIGRNTTSLTFFNMGVTLSDVRLQINQTSTFTPTLVAASYT